MYVIIDAILSLIYIVNVSTYFYFYLFSLVNVACATGLPQGRWKEKSYATPDVNALYTASCNGHTAICDLLSSYDLEPLTLSEEQDVWDSLHASLIYDFFYAVYMNDVAKVTEMIAANSALPNAQVGLWKDRFVGR